jgi:hypothetical protein
MILKEINNLFCEVNLNDKKSILIILASFLCVFALKQYLMSFFLSLILFSIACLSVFWKRFTRLSLGIELNSFLTIILSLAYGSKVGIVFGVLSVLVGYILAQRVCLMMLIPMAGSIFVAAIADHTAFLGVVMAGILLNILYNIFIHTFYVFIFRFNPASSMMSFSINLILNLVLFTSFSQEIMKILTGV